MLRRAFIDGLVIGLRLVWPVLSILVSAIAGLGLVVGAIEGWSVQDSLYFAYVSGLTIGYGDFAPKYTLTKILAVVIGLVGFLFTGILVAIAVESLRYTITGKSPLDKYKE